MALLEKPNIMAKAIVDSTIMRLGRNLSQELVQSIRARNDAVWHDKKSWFLWFYFGSGDDRLWVPRKTRKGPHPTHRVINFGHPHGRQASRILMIAYLIGAVSVVLVSAIVLGYRW